MNLNGLRKLGLSDYEAKCYVALLMYGNMQGKDIAAKSGVPPTSVYRNIESLCGKGFVSIVSRDPFFYSAIDPAIAVTSYVSLKEKELKELEYAAVLDLNSLKDKKRIEKREEVLDVYTGRKQSYTLGKKLILKSKKSFLIIGTGNKQSILDIIHSLDTAVKNGVRCCFVVTQNSYNTELIKRLIEKGINVRYSPLAGFSMLIKDRVESQIVIKDTKLKNERVVLHIKNKDLAKAHADYFDLVWKKAISI